MANRKRDAGREALEKKGWWRSHRWLVLRRLCQFFVLGMFLSGPWFGVWILHGNYSSSLLFDTVPLTDPLMTLQSLASGHLPATVALTGAVIITVLYALAMYVPIDNLWLRLLWRTILLLAFLAYIIRRDLPLSQWPVIGKYFAKRKG